MLNKQQKEAETLISTWYKDKNSKQIFCLAGYAGTGKTYLINHLVKNVFKLREDQVAFIAPTGKAASVITQNSGYKAQTLHALIYTALESEQITEVDKKKIVSKKIEFIKKAEIPNYHLIILDEVSMVDAKMMKDLLSYGAKVLCCGDSGQLPPPISKSSHILDNPDYTLTEIVRQAADNAIIQIATKARLGEYIPYGNYGDVIVVSPSSLDEEQMKYLLCGADQVICGTNSNRTALNDIIRKYKGIDTTEHPYPLDGEKVICTVNNWKIALDDDDTYYLVNGTIGYCVGDYVVENKDLNIGTLSFTPDFLPGTIKHDIVSDSGIFENYEYTYDMHQHVFLTSDHRYILKEMYRPKENDETDGEFKKRIVLSIINSKKAIDESQLNRIEFSWAISCHKSQGSEWDKCVVFDESKVFRNDRNKWLYTAITRAKKKLVIIR